MATAGESGGSIVEMDDGNILTVTPLGAGSEVGRSCIVVTYRGRTVMFDCGVHPGMTGANVTPMLDAVDLTEIDLCLITHFHLDHAAAVPYLMQKTVFSGRVYMTEPTRAICHLLWQDYAKVSPDEDGGGAALYSQEDIAKSMHDIRTIDFRQELVHKGIEFTCFGAGHVLGACMFLVTIDGVRILYTGDYSREDDRHVPMAEVPELGGKAVDVLICESTYGIHVHENRRAREARLLRTVHDIVRREGRVLMPVFALGRAQELLLILEEYWERHRFLRENVPIYFISPMSKKSLRVFETFIGLCGDKVREIADTGENPFKFKHIKTKGTLDQTTRDILKQKDQPCVVMAAPGMLQTGASRAVFEMWADDRRSCVVLTGYSVKGTLAEDLRRERDSVTIQGRNLPVRMSVENISFSAHADFDQTRAFVHDLQARYVVLVHGERSEMRKLKTKLEELIPDCQVHTPENMEPVFLAVESREAQSVQIVGGLAERVNGFLRPGGVEGPEDDRIEGRVKRETFGGQREGGRGGAAVRQEKGGEGGDDEEEEEEEEEITAVLVRGPNTGSLLVDPRELSQYVSVSAHAIAQEVFVPFQCDRPVPPEQPAASAPSRPLTAIEVLQATLSHTFGRTSKDESPNRQEEAGVQPQGFTLCDSVRVSPDVSRQSLVISWMSSPAADLVADSVCVVAREVGESSGPALKRMAARCVGPPWGGTSAAEKTRDALSCDGHQSAESAGESATSSGQVGRKRKAEG